MAVSEDMVEARPEAIGESVIARVDARRLPRERPLCPSIGRREIWLVYWPVSSERSSSGGCLSDVTCATSATIWFCDWHQRW